MSIPKATPKLTPGQIFPLTEIPTLGGDGTVTLGRPRKGSTWQLILVYRGIHCPLCTKYLAQWNYLLPTLEHLNIDLVAVSADTEERVKAHLTSMKLGFDVGYGLTVKQMKSLGLYISNPKRPEEAPGPFSEPAMFAVLEDGTLRIAELASSPFLRPDIQTILRGLTLMRDPSRNFNIRGADWP